MMIARPLVNLHVRRSDRSRRGATILIVLSLILIALAISYALMRSQMTASRIQNNSNLDALARQTALTGLATGMRKMHENAWAGVGTSLTGSTSSTESYVVSFTAGDASLTAGGPDYSELPYRVTLIATGTARDPANSQLKSSHSVQAVMRLVPRQLGATTADWTSMRQYTVYQHAPGAFSLDVPCRVEGPVRLQGAVTLGSDYSWSSTARNRYLGDLNAMRLGVNEVQTIVRTGGSGTYQLVFKGQTTGSISSSASASSVDAALEALSSVGSGNVQVSSVSGNYAVTFTGALGAQDVPQISSTNVNLGGGTIVVTTTTPGVGGLPDYRPLSGVVSMPLSLTDGTNQNLLTSQLGLTLQNISVTASSGVALPATLASYRVYRGGPTYTPAQLPSNLTNTTLDPDPATNPLGIYFRSSGGSIGSNVTVRGTLIYNGDLSLNGTNVIFNSLDLPAVVGSAGPVHLPAAVINQNCLVGSTMDGRLNGFLVTGRQFLIDRGLESASFAVTGRVISGDFIIRRRQEWNYNSLTWDLIYSLFNNQLTGGSTTPIPFFPVYLSALGRNPKPTLTVIPDSTSVREHWQDLADPVYVPHANDPGLLWELVSWADDP